MPPQLLPASAAAFAPRASSVNVVLGSKVEPWLTQTLKRINRIKRPLNSVPQHQRCLTETLSSTNAIWTLASLMVAKAPDSELRKDSNPLVEALFNYQLIHVEAYIVHVDMVLRNEVAYKLTPDTIESLIEYHKDIHCVNAKASTYDWSEKEQQCKKLHEDFIQAINKFVYRTHVSALEGLEEDGAGELLCGDDHFKYTSPCGCLESVAIKSKRNIHLGGFKCHHLGQYGDGRGPSPFSSNAVLQPAVLFRRDFLQLTRRDSAYSAPATT
ncbi:hypothetical protein UCRPA7_1726 [Phaeoacremonium minimum UCRPA7]|uniref:Uncharacterized protein n=1 Tax=Phaeoacremonium minimum (strain UCR-PA7) TaxID=1286976 RepID=R8BTQ3_PHAM7|nr:hypothetical protein UCRPA7_1726 [Phaeoacremonium minimum UCRPA7]EOO02746.1 hypothetical protein UCRPA7_1726 [Phaeoacremonium minimum UCRPA7]